MPTIASRLRPGTRLLRVATLASLLLITTLGCGSFRSSTDGMQNSMGLDACTGCGQEDCHAGFCICTKDYVRCLDEKQAVHDAIARAKIAMRSDYASKPSKDVRAGYRDAFVDITLGASGELPPVPPERYWSVCYRTADGHARARDWFAGYGAGASRALATCRQRYNTIPSSGQAAFTAGQTPASTNHHPFLGYPAGAGW